MYGTLLAFDLLLLAFFVVACVLNTRAAKPHPDIYLDQWHHGYLGDALALLGWATHSWVLLCLGVFLRLDDTWQHVSQLSDRYYVSPLAHFYATDIYWRFAWVRRLNAWLDRVFGNL